MIEDSDWERSSEMKQSIASAYGSSILTEDETQVLEILLQLHRLISESEARHRFPFSWGCKRRRSVIQVTPSSSPPLPSPLHHPTCGGGVVLKTEASSPATPLSFSPSESDEKPKLSQRKISLKRKREEHLKKIEDLTKTNYSLRREIENVKVYYDKLKAYNLKLKARKLELSIGPKVERENPCLECGKQMQIVHASVNSSNSMAEQQLPHYLPLILNQTSRPSQISESEGVVQFQHESTTSLPMPSSTPSASSMVNNNNNMGPRGIPDLNISLVEDSLQALDVSMAMANKNLSRAMAAEARQKRIQIYRSKSKNSIGISKPRYSCR